MCGVFLEKQKGEGRERLEEERMERGRSSTVKRGNDQEGFGVVY